MKRKMNGLIIILVFALFFVGAKSYLVDANSHEQQEVAISSGVAIGGSELPLPIHINHLENRSSGKSKTAYLVKETVQKVSSVTTEEPSIKKEEKVVPKKINGEYMPTVDLNMRKEGNLTSPVIKTLSKYSKLVASESVHNAKDSITWFKVTQGNVTGWVSSNYLTTYKKIEVPKVEKKKNVQPNKKSNHSIEKKSNPSGVAASRDDQSKVQKSNVSKSNTPKYKPMHIYFGGKAVPYKNGGKANGQSIIDKSGFASTWGGASFSAHDGRNTHFIGHNGGRNQFGGMHTQSTFIVTDANGNAYKYVKTTRYVVDEYGKRTDNGANMFDRIAGTGGGERIVLQSTKKHPLKWIVEAKYVGQVQ